MKTLTTKQRRTYRARRKIQRPVDTGRLRLHVFRSAKHIYAQVIDDNRGLTVAQANSKALGAAGSKVEQAREVGKVLAERAKDAGVDKVVFDRGPYRYHGRVQALADGAREGGLDF